MSQESMSYSARMKSAIERDIEAISLRPSVARGQDRMTVVAGPDAVCTARDGHHNLKIDLGRSHGGEGTTPGPGFLVSAALGACMAQACINWAAYFDVPVNRVSVEMLADFDVTTALGLEGDASCAYTNVRLVIEIDSSAPPADIEHVVDTAASRDFMLAVFDEAHPVERELRITNAAAA